MSEALEQLRDTTNAGDALVDLRELNATANRESLGTLAALAVPFGIEEATPGLPFDPAASRRCSRYCDRAEDCQCID
jgi:hypothetical protein